VRRAQHNAKRALNEAASCESRRKAADLGFSAHIRSQADFSTVFTLSLIG
jgi:hypothetical protein